MTNLDGKTISLDNLGIKDATVRYQLTSDELHNTTIEKEQGVETSFGALAVRTGEFTGRSPMDRFIVKDDITKDEIWKTRLESETRLSCVVFESSLSLSCLCDNSMKRGSLCLISLNSFINSS